MPLALSAQPLPILPLLTSKALKLSYANLLGICRFVELYHSEYNKGRLIAKLRQVDAFTIFRLARTAGVSLPGKTKYLQQVYTIYNGGSRRAALPLKF